MKQFVLCAALFCAVVTGISAQIETAQPVDEEVSESSLIFSDDGEAAVDQPVSSVPGLGAWELGRMVLVLAVVIGAIWLLFLFLKRVSVSRFPATNIMRLVASLPISGNRALHIVEVGSQLFLVGVGDQSISLISELTHQETIDEIRLKSSAGQVGERLNFTDMLGGMFQREGTNGSVLNFLKQGRERLRKL